VGSSLQMSIFFFSNGKPIHHFFKSSVWSGIKIHIGTLIDNSLWIVGTGENIYIWTDNWLGKPLVDLFHIDLYFHVGFRGKVSKIIFDGVWNLPPTLLVNEVTDRLDTIVLPRVPLPDTLVWSHSVDGKLTSKNEVVFLRSAAPHLPWADLIWNGCIPPSNSFTFWRLMHRNMPTDENPQTRGCVIVSVCCFCLTIDETSELISSVSICN